jgi:uncharacterized protein (DUF58 family)
MLFLMIASIPIGLQPILSWTLYAAIAYLIVISITCALDYLLNPIFRKVEAYRSVDSKLSLGAENPVTITLKNDSPYTLSFQIKDDFPPEFRFSAIYHELIVPPVSRRSLVYHLRPIRRGRYRFGDIHLRCRGVLGLVTRQRTIPAEEEIRVYPSIIEIRKYELLARRGRLHEIGLKSSRLYGTGTELERLREYQPDDDYRHIDWKATARRNQPITREFELERSQNIFIMIDSGRRMAAQLGDLVKLDYAVNASVMAGYVCTLRGDRIGILTFSDRIIRYIVPRSGKTQFYRILESLYDLQPELVEPDYRRAFQYLASKHKKRSLIILFTDILDEETAQDLLVCIQVLARYHMIMCVTLSDTNILNMAKRHPRRSEDVYRRFVAEKLLREKREALDLLSTRGVITLDVPADRLTMSVVNRYLELKARSMI